MELTLTELEAAINHWRLKRPSSGEECALSPEVGALAGVYAMMIFERRSSVPLASLGTDAQQLIAASRTAAAQPDA